MSKEMLKNLIDLIDENDAETIFRVLIKFIPEDIPEADEISALSAANERIAKNGTVSMKDIDWD